MGVFGAELDGDEDCDEGVFVVATNYLFDLDNVTKIIYNG